MIVRLWNTLGCSTIPLCAGSVRGLSTRTERDTFGPLEVPADKSVNPTSRQMFFQEFQTLSEGMYQLHANTVAPDCTRMQVLGRSDTKIIPELQNWWT